MNHLKAPQHGLLIHLNDLKSKLQANNYQSQLNASHQIQLCEQLMGTFQNILSSLGNRLYNLQNENNQLINKLSKYQNVKPYTSNQSHIDDQLINLLVTNYNEQHNFYPDKDSFKVNDIKLQYLQQQELNFDQINQNNMDFSHFRNPIKKSSKIQSSIKNGVNHSNQQKYLLQPSIQSNNYRNNGFNYIKKEPIFTNGSHSMVVSSNKLDQFVQKKVQYQNNLKGLKPNSTANSTQIQNKNKFRQQSANVAKFIKGHLVHQLQQHQDHKRYLIPKKILLKKYLQWSKINEIANVLLDKQNLIQMCLTNELKLVFKGIDCYTKSYRGLKFKRSEFRASEDDNYQKYEYYNANCDQFMVKK